MSRRNASLPSGIAVVRARFECHGRKLGSPVRHPIALIAEAFCAPAASGAIVRRASKLRGRDGGSSELEQLVDAQSAACIFNYANALHASAALVAAADAAHRFSRPIGIHRLEAGAYRESGVRKLAGALAEKVGGCGSCANSRILVNARRDGEWRVSDWKVLRCVGDVWDANRKILE